MSSASSPSSTSPSPNSNANASPSSSTPPLEVHLLVLVHGMWGNTSHLAEMARVVKEDRPAMHVLLAETNTEDSTYDGIDWGGERVASEIMEEIALLESQGKRVTKFSMTGYSLGGLVSRYVVGILSQRGLFSSIQPINFNTIATPHLGIPKYPSFFNSVTRNLGPKLLSRTGEQFYCVDRWGASGRPLLDVMADPSLLFYQSLALFKHVRIYANAINDLTVPYVSAAIELDDPFAEYAVNGLEVSLDEKFSPIIQSYRLPDVPPPKKKKPLVLTKDWFKERKEQTPLLPPFLQFRFPLNVVFYLSTPLLIPIVLTMVVVRLSRASRSSQARIQLLEKEIAEKQEQMRESSNGGDSQTTQTLAQLISSLGAKLEREMEDAVADFIDRPGDMNSPTPSDSPSPAPSRSSPSLVDPSSTSTSLKPLQNQPSSLSPSPSPSAVKPINPSSQPILSPLQKLICARLNTLPGLKKERAFIARVRNSHASIISRDVGRFESHRIGEGVLRHWAGAMIE